MMSTVATVSTMSTRVSRHCYQASTSQLLNHYDVYNIYSLYSLYKDFQGLLMRVTQKSLKKFTFFCDRRAGPLIQRRCTLRHIPACSPVYFPTLCHFPSLCAHCVRPCFLCIAVPCSLL